MGWRKIKVWFERRFGSPFPGAVDAGFEVRMKVHQAWKGRAAPEMVIYTWRDEAGCGFRFRPGSRYVVYARLEGEQVYEASLCSRTRLRGEDSETTALDRLAGSKKSNKRLQRRSETLARLKRSIRWHAHGKGCAGYLAAVLCESRAEARPSSSGLFRRICLTGAARHRFQVEGPRGRYRSNVVAYLSKRSACVGEFLARSVHLGAGTSWGLSKRFAASVNDVTPNKQHSGGVRLYSLDECCSAAIAHSVQE